MKITLTNDFHGTSVNLIAEDDARNTSAGWLSARQVKRAQNELCGISGCCCGDDLGCRGRQDYLVEVQHDRDGHLIARVEEIEDEQIIY